VSILDSFFESLLDVPEHQVLHSLVFCENPLEPIKVPLLDAVDKRATFGHEFHEIRWVIRLHGLNLFPKTPNKRKMVSK